MSSLRGVDPQGEGEGELARRAIGFCGDDQDVAARFQTVRHALMRNDSVPVSFSAAALSP